MTTKEHNMVTEAYNVVIEYPYKDGTPETDARIHDLLQKHNGELVNIRRIKRPVDNTLLDSLTIEFPDEESSNSFSKECTSFLSSTF